MKLTTLFTVLLVATGASAVNAAGHADADGNPMVGGAPMFADKNIIENAVNSADHTTLVAAVQAADLVDALQGPGPFTVFAPVNDAFAALPAGTVETLLKPENKDQLVKILTAHVVAGNLDADDLKRAARRSSDRFVHLETLSGDAISVKLQGGSLYVFDENGNAAKITISDVGQSNGVIHVVNKVLLPN